MAPGVRWTNLSLRDIAAELRPRGFRVSVPVVTQLLRKHRLGRRKAQKRRPCGRHPDQDRQFQRIAALRARYRATGHPILSVDTKKKEFLGELFRVGRAYTTHTLETADHDFPRLATGVVFPHGIYDTERNCGHINLGVSHDTSRFAADSLESWWRVYGKPVYPHATSILLLCDGGGSNAASRYVFKSALETLVRRIGVEIRVAHYPPYCSKYNPIEHRMFPHVTKACQGVVFYSTEMVVRAMARTRTRTGLRTTVAILAGEYPTGEKAPSGYKKTMGIVFDDDLPKWNYRAVPAKPGS
jgi:hypothetical protein